MRFKGRSFFTRWGIFFLFFFLLLPQRSHLEELELTGEGWIENGMGDSYFLRGYSWYLVGLHSHTTYSDGNLTVKELLEYGAYDEGMGALSITDHNTLEQCSDPDFHPTGNLIPIRAEEWSSSFGHAGLHGLTGDTPVTTSSIEEMIAETTTRGGIIIIHHPKSEDAPWAHDYLDEGIDGIEVWNSFFFMKGGQTAQVNNNQEAVNWWHGFLAEGKRITGVAASDYHQWPQSLGDPSVLVLARSNSNTDILKNIVAGHVIMVSSENSGKVFLWADKDNNGTYDTPVGQNISVSAPQKVTFTIEVYGASGDEIIVYTKSGKRFSQTVGSGNPWRYSRTVTLRPETHDFIRVELRPNWFPWNMISMTNPIYINY